VQFKKQLRSRDVHIVPIITLTKSLLIRPFTKYETDEIVGCVDVTSIPDEYLNIVGVGAGVGSAILAHIK
jgi:hypothetical protein